MNRSIVILAAGVLATGCAVAVNTSGSRGNATESSLMQADRDFAVATHARVESPLLTHTLFPVYVAVLLWVGLLLRETRLRELLPLRA